MNGRVKLHFGCCVQTRLRHAQIRFGRNFDVERRPWNNRHAMACFFEQLRVVRWRIVAPIIVKLRQQCPVKHLWRLGLIEFTSIFGCINRLSILRPFERTIDGDGWNGGFVLNG